MQGFSGGLGLEQNHSIIILYTNMVSYGILGQNHSINIHKHGFMQGFSRGARTRAKS